MLSWDMQLLWTIGSVAVCLFLVIKYVRDVRMDAKKNRVGKR